MTAASNGFNLIVQVTGYEAVVARSLKGVQIEGKDRLIIDEATVSDKSASIILSLRNGMLQHTEKNVSITIP